MPSVDYHAFLVGKARAILCAGVEPGELHPSLFPFQADVVRWAVRLGLAAIFADTGLGKTRMLLEWARHFAGRVLILAPLGVTAQTVREGEKLGLTVKRVREVLELEETGIFITNYERAERFVAERWDAVVLDESSILKAHDGATRKLLTDGFAVVPRRLCCTATPAPNDVTELCNHAAFLGVMTRVEMLATYFVHDDDGWRLKGHAEDALWRWVATWAVYVRRPSDLGCSDDGFALPPLIVRDERVATDWKPPGQLLATGLDGGIGTRSKVRRYTMDARVARAAAIIADSNEQWVVWCGLNDEQDALAKMLGDECVSVAGKDADDTKVERATAWQEGRVRVLLTKSKIYGYGMNWQHCHRVLFLGLGDSWEQYYQAVRRCWRYGQTEAVEATVIISTAEEEIAANISRKEDDHAHAAERVVACMRDEQIRQIHGGDRIMEYDGGKTAKGEGWELMRGDCVERIADVADESVGLSVFSPPFASLYTYSASDRDMGNSASYEQFFGHFAFLIPELLRVTIPGRRCCVHVQQLSTTMASNGVIGWRDFRADVVKLFVAAGWVYDGEVVIDKDPQAQAIRTHSKALLFVQKERDASWLRPAMADYIILFRHPGANPVPIKVDVSNEEWIEWARPIWYGIRESDTLQYMNAREDKDERHICPLQLGTIERCVRLWSNPGELVLSPFAGIGSEGHVALRQKRRFVGIELKETYWKNAANNLRASTAQLDLFGAP